MTCSFVFPSMAYSPSSLDSASTISVADGEKIIIRGSPRLRENTRVNSSRALGKKSKREAPSASLDSSADNIEF